MDERLAQVEKDKQNALNNSNNFYNQIIQNNQDLYNQQNQYANTYEQTQNELLDKQLAHNEQLINQQKDIARQNMETESRKAKNDFTAYTNPYGLQAEQFASQGLLNSGVSETAKLGGYNTYQNRLASANKAMQDAFVQYDNDINQARLNNDVTKAQNALEKLKMQLQYSESFYNNKNTYLQNQLSTNQNLDSEYYNRYQTTYNNIQSEKAKEEAIRQWEKEFAEQQRQYNESMAYQKEQDKQSQANWEKEYALSKSKARTSGSGGYSLTSGSTSLNNGTIANQQIVTPYYQGKINSDVQYGTFDSEDNNGVKYQPNNVGGAPLSKSGLTVSEALGTTGNKGKSGANIDNQNVWRTEDGNYYVWDGSQNKYINITSQIPKEENKSSYWKSVELPSITNNVDNIYGIPGVYKSYK